MNNLDWQTRFREIYDRGALAWKTGRRSARSMFEDQDAAFLESIGCTRQELFDFIEDAQASGEPDFDAVLAVQAIRRDYFQRVQGGRWSGRVASMDDLPPKAAEVDGIPWLPRIIAKARLKLRGEMPPELMYGCGGDRPFLRSVNMTLPEFLKRVWDAGENDRPIIDAIQGRS